MKSFHIICAVFAAWMTSSASAWHPEQLSKPDQCKVGMRVVNNTGEAGTVTSVVNDWCYFKKDSGKDGVLLYWLLRPEGTGSSSEAHKSSTGNAPSAAQKSFGALPLGSVWSCNLPGIGMFTGAYFGILDGSTYRNFDGKTGSYSFDAASGILKMTSGSSKGLSYKRQSENNFRVLDDKGRITGGNCVWVKEKSINGKW